MNNYIRTCSGKKFSIENMDIDIDDIAEALSNVYRYNGHLGTNWSVAQHSIVVSDIVGICTGDKKLALAGLLHDASEAYLPDVPSPFKAYTNDYVKLEETVLKSIFNKFNVEYPYSPIIHSVDKNIVDWEIFSFRPEWKEHKRTYTAALVSLYPEQCKKLFLERFNTLSG